MSAYKLALIAAIVALVEARFGQEQIPGPAIQALDGKFGSSGQASTLAGSVPGSLLGATNPCDKLKLADQIVATLGTDPAVISAAAGLVAAEQNFNPFATSIPNICGDASLPATQALRGILPKVDPAVTDAATANALSAQSLTTPFDATGLSVAQVMIAQGFTNLAIDGKANAGAATGGSTGNTGNTDATTGNNNANTGADTGNNNADTGADTGNNNANTGADTATDCGGAADTNTDAATGNNNANTGNNNANTGNNNANTGNNNANTGNNNGNTGNNNGNTGATTGTGGADFGLCDPRMDFQFGRGNRKATEGTFAPVDAQIGGQDALNPNIITQRICDQLTNVCQSDAAAKALCQTARAEVEAAGSRGPEIADLFNKGLGL